MYISDNKAEHGLPGDIVDLLVTLKDPKQWVDIRSGLTLSSTNFMVPVTARFQAVIYLYDINTPILKGTRCDFHFGPNAESGILKRINFQKDPLTLENLKKNPRFLLSKMAAAVEIVLDREMCLELEMNFASLGKF